MHLQILKVRDNNVTRLNPNLPATPMSDGKGKKRARGRKSMGRRVSFAPEGQLETMHEFQV